MSTAPSSSGSALAVVAVGAHAEPARDLHVLVDDVERRGTSKPRSAERLAVAAQAAAEVEHPPAGALGHELHERGVDLRHRIGVAVPGAGVAQAARHARGAAPSRHRRIPTTTSRLRGLIA